MDLVIDAELKAILQDIVREARSPEEWAEIEADDIYQSDRYCGGYDTTEEAFTFSYYDSDGVEWWFQVCLREAESVVEGLLTHVECRRAEK